MVVKVRKVSIQYQKNHPCLLEAPENYRHAYSEFPSFLKVQFTNLLLFCPTYCLHTQNQFHHHCNSKILFAHHLNIVRTSYPYYKMYFASMIAAFI